MSDRISLNGPGLPYGDPTDVDEVVHVGWVHLEMLGEASAYLHLHKVDPDGLPSHDHTALAVYARRMTRAEHQALRASDGARLRDLPRAAHSYVAPSGVVRRWRAALAEWWAGLRRGAVLVVSVTDDELGLTEDRS